MYLHLQSTMNLQCTIWKPACHSSLKSLFLDSISAVPTSSSSSMALLRAVSLSARVATKLFISGCTGSNSSTSDKMAQGQWRATSFSCSENGSPTPAFWRGVTERAISSIGIEPALSARFLIRWFKRRASLECMASSNFSAIFLASVRKRQAEKMLRCY